MLHVREGFIYHICHTIMRIIRAVNLPHSRTRCFLLSCLSLPHMPEYNMYNTDATRSSQLNEKPLTRGQGETLALQVNAYKYVECSAKTREGLREVWTLERSPPPLQCGPHQMSRFICLSTELVITLSGKWYTGMLMHVRYVRCLLSLYAL